MKVKVGDRIYDGAEQPVLVELTDQDRANIAAMPSGHRWYCVYPSRMTMGQARAWMREPDRPPKLRLFCECCGEFRPFRIEHVDADILNVQPWGDLLCEACHFVIGTLTADPPGTYALVRVGD